MGLRSLLRRSLLGVFETQEALSEEDVQRGLKMLMANAAFGMGAGALQGGIFLSAFALAIGATNYEIGLLATVAFVSQFMQLPGLYLVQKLGMRRGITVVAAGVSRLLWIFVILIPVLFVGKGVSFLLVWLVMASLAMAVCVPSWNSLLRAVVPSDAFGRFFGRRLALGTSVALALTLAGGYFVDWWGSRYHGEALYAYSILFLLGLAFGLIELVAIARVPEPRMERGPQTSLLDVLATPVRDTNFRKLLVFIAVWNFATNMAVPFFIIYMLNRIGLSLFMVTILSTTSQLTNILFLRIWGRLGDRFSNKSVLSVSGPLFLLAIVAWCFTTMPESYFLTLPLLFLIHVLSGMSMAGITLGSSNIALKLSPQGSAHAYMTVFGLAGSVTGAIAPVAGGVIADFFALRELSLSVNWSEPTRQLSLYALNFRALDFLFALAFLIGFYALSRLGQVVEHGEVEESEVVEELLSEMAMPLRSFSAAAGIRRLAVIPVHAFAEGELNRPEDSDGSTPAR